MRQTLGKTGRWLLLLLLLGQSGPGVDAAAEGPQKRTEATSGEMMQMGGGDSTTVEAVKRRRQN